jgi:hypothetical protein
MTSVPKPLKFLRPHYPDLQALHETWPASDDKVRRFNLFCSYLVTIFSTELVCRHTERVGYDIL